METVNDIELSDPSVFPDETVLRDVLGGSYPAYRALVALFDRNQLVYEWRYYQDGKAWLCKVQSKNRTIVWMSAWRGFVKATVYFLERHLDELHALPISAETKQRIMATRNVGRSKACIFEIRDEEVLEDLDAVLRLKMRVK